MSKATETFQMLGRRFFVAAVRAHKTRTDTIVIILHEEDSQDPVWFHWYAPADHAEVITKGAVIISPTFERLKGMVDGELADIEPIQGNDGAITHIVRVTAMLGGEKPQGKRKSMAAVFTAFTEAKPEEAKPEEAKD
jgi:hypothetical protein